MSRILYEITSVAFLVAAALYAGLAAARGIPGAWMLFVAPCVVYGVITISQRLPITSLNLTVKVTPENAPRIEPLARDFLASLKAFTLLLIVWVDAFAASRVQIALFVFVEAAILVTIFAQIVAFFGKVKKLA